MNKLLLKMVLVLAVAVTATHYLTKMAMDKPVAGNGERQPLYWAAPMDPNYRRDRPGKSPMGMELIPVYGDRDGFDTGPGTISISPDVVNNLGVRTAKAQMETLHTTITTVGYVQYDEDRLLHIHPRVEGWVEELYIKATGDPVQKGQALYALYSPQLVNAQEELLLAINRKKLDSRPSRERSIEGTANRRCLYRAINAKCQNSTNSHLLCATIRSGGQPEHSPRLLCRARHYNDVDRRIG